MGVDWANKYNTITEIRRGTVIDHLNPAEAFAIVRELNLEEKMKKLGYSDSEEKVSLGARFSSRRAGHKDFLKWDGYQMPENEAKSVLNGHPHATVNVIDSRILKNEVYTDGKEEIYVAHKYAVRNGQFVDLAEKDKK